MQSNSSSSAFYMLSLLTQYKVSPKSPTHTPTPALPKINCKKMDKGRLVELPLLILLGYFLYPPVFSCLLLALNSYVMSSLLFPSTSMLPHV